MTVRRPCDGGARRRIRERLARKKNSALRTSLAMASSGTIQRLPNGFVRRRSRAEFFAQTSLGYLYERGEGVPQDYALASMWLNLATAQGQPVAKTEMDRLAAKMTPNQIAEAQRLAREWKPTTPFP